ncbi:MAG: hypothetical protein N4J56_005973 [Chroococcidiopsis sp. SAG 2025]|uniref:hypothetical protein n=1 Tax=Chroococcidiopsis sp. SAG 2025 TaxID=171389 RepID=UPI00293712F7|nr:hypothetical protein [Chroococcidiopsis sp. SAG 2025]MDV2996319.1 hypothetical protein [Chroococcidiopsis sp. SAG 2025]
MVSSSATSTTTKAVRKVPLHAISVVSFVLQIFAAVEVTEYLSLRNEPMLSLLLPIARSILLKQ